MSSTLSLTMPSFQAVVQVQQTCTGIIVRSAVVFADKDQEIASIVVDGQTVYLHEIGWAHWENYFVELANTMVRRVQEEMLPDQAVQVCHFTLEDK